MADETPGLFRQAAVLKAAAPDQLDAMIRIVTPGGWLVAAALGLVVAAAVAWSLLGTISFRVAGEGLLMREAGVVDVASPAAGEVQAVLVAPGARVEPGQVVARIDQPELTAQLRSLRQAETEVAAKHDLLVALGAEGLVQRRAALSAREAAARTSIASLRDRLARHEEKLAAEERLLSKGLITRETVLATRATCDELRERRDTASAELSAVSAERSELSKGTEERRLALVEQRNDLRRKIDQVQAELELRSRVVAEVAGKVIEVKAAPGDFAAPGRPVVAVEPQGSAAGELIAVAYVPLQDGRRLREGMDALVTPSTVKREESGSIRGTVRSVSPFPSTPEDMARTLRNADLVTRLSAGGPVHEVRIALTRDPEAPSGFRWSGGRGPTEPVTSGTHTQALVTVKRQPPASLLLPFLRHALGVED